MGFFFPLGDIASLIIKACLLSAKFRAVFLTDPEEWCVKFKDFFQLAHVCVNKKTKNHKAQGTNDSVLQHATYWDDLNIALYKTVHMMLFYLYWCTVSLSSPLTLKLRLYFTLKWYNQHKIKMDSPINNIPHPHNVNQSTRMTRKAPNTPWRLNSISFKLQLKQLPSMFHLRFKWHRT